MDNNQLLQVKKALDEAIAQKKLSQELLRNLGPAVIDTLRPVLDEIAKNAKISKEELLNVLSQIKIDAPKVDMPQTEVKVTIPEIIVPEPKVTVNVDAPKIPEIKIPKIVVPKPEVTVNVPPFPKIPDLQWPKEKMPIKGEVQLMDVSLQNPLPVQIRDANGKPVDFAGNFTQVMSGGGGGGGGFTKVKNKSNAQINPATEETLQGISSNTASIVTIENALQELVSRLSFLPSVRGIAADLRVTLLSGTVTAVTTVTTVTGITNIGGIPAVQLIPSNQNQVAILSNINNISVN